MRNMIYISIPLAGEEYSGGIKTLIASATVGSRSKSNVTWVLTFSRLHREVISSRYLPWRTVRVTLLGYGSWAGVGWKGMIQPPALSYCTAPEERRIIYYVNMGQSWNYTEGNKKWLVGQRNISQCKFVRHKSSICKSPYFIWQIPFIIPTVFPPCAWGD